MGKSARDLLRHQLFAPVVLGLSVAIVLTGVALLVTTSTASNTPPATQGVASSAPVTADITGAVANPGVYTLPANVRVVGLVNAAGGALPTADLERVNLAAPLFDGMAVFIPTIGQIATPALVKVSINSASATTLQQQLGLSKKTADAIINYRAQHGPYSSIEQLLLVPISKAIYDKIKDRVTV